MPPKRRDPEAPVPEASYHPGAGGPWDLPDVALLIDWENLKVSLGRTGSPPNVGALYEAASEFGRVVIARAYMDWQESGMETDPYALYRAGVEPVYVPKKRFARPPTEGAPPPIVKNSVDVRMAADAATIVHTNPNIRTFVLVSGDQDFLHIVNSLRPFGRKVVLIGVSTSLSQQLAEFVDRVIFYDRELERAPGRTPPQEAPKDSPTIEDVLDAIPEILRSSTPAGVGLFSYIGAELKKKYPTYHPRAHGFRTFRQLMDRAKEKGAIAGYEIRGVQSWAYLKGAEQTLRDLIGESENPP